MRAVEPRSGAPRGPADDPGGGEPRVGDRSPDPIAAQGLRARYGGWSWGAAAALVLGNFFLHKPISDVCDALFARIGRASYERVTLLTIAALSAGGALLLCALRGAALRRGPVVAALLGVAACTVAAQRWLLVSNVELIHLPQFGLLAAFLLLSGLSPQAAWSVATIAGVFDEAYQYLVIYAHVPGTYFDYNDIVLNAIGAAWAVILGAADGSRRAPRRGRDGALLAASAGALAIAWWLAPPRLTMSSEFPYCWPVLVRAATGLGYHVMSASEGVAVLLVLWRLVVLATRASRAALPLRQGMAAALAIVTLAGCLRGAPPARPVDGTTAVEPVHDRAGSAAAAAPQRQRAAPAIDAALIITFWCGPPLAELTDARAAEIAAAGFNVVGAPCEGAVTTELNRRALDVAARHGLTVWIADPRLSRYYDDLDPNWEALLTAAVADYADHQALGGYFLIDEPGAEKFDDLGRVVARLRAADPQRTPYINLLPDFAPPEALGTETYREHVEQFMAVVHPPLLSFDYYPFKTDTDRDTFFDNLGVVRDVAQAHGVPFMLIVQAMPHGSYRDPTEGEMAWQVNHALAFGARGISYFAYWTPVGVPAAEHWHFRHGLVEDGRATEHLYQAARINSGARAIGAQLDGWRSIAVVDSQGRFGTPLPVGPLAGLSGGPVTAGLFSDRDGGMAVLLVNQDYRAPTRAQLLLQPGVPPPQAFDPKTSRWHPLVGANVALPPGAGVLLRWT